MNYATNFALIENGKVANVCWGMVYNMTEFPNAVQIDDRAVTAGDDYIDGNFYRNGELVRTNAEIMLDMQEALATMGVVPEEEVVLDENVD